MAAVFDRQSMKQRLHIEYKEFPCNFPKALQKDAASQSEIQIVTRYSFIDFESVCSRFGKSRKNTQKQAAFVHEDEGRLCLSLKP